jgi:hypothetical protein
LKALIKSLEMTQFQPSEIQEFLEAVDSFLKSSFDLLALMKIVRGYENDIQTICEIHENLPFCFETLIERFLTEMTQVIGNSNTIRMNFLLAISELFGDELADQAEELSKNWQS